MWVLFLEMFLIVLYVALLLYSISMVCNENVSSVLYFCMHASVSLMDVIGNFLHVTNNVMGVTDNLMGIIDNLLSVTDCVSYITDTLMDSTDNLRDVSYRYVLMTLDASSQVTSLVYSILMFG